MKRTSDLKRRLESLGSLLEAISAMKSISAHHLRQARADLGPARRYKTGLDAAVEQAGVPLPAGGGGAAGLVVIGAELGLCGAYNAHVAQQALHARRELGAGPIFCVGHRVGTLLKRGGLVPTAMHAMPTGPAGITPVLLALTESVLIAYFEGRLSRVDVVAAAFRGVGDFTPATTRLLPVASPAGGAPGPGHAYVSVAHLQEVVVREMLYITLYRQMLEALASEHGARLVATQSAETWLRDRSERLRRGLTAAKREASTQETIEIAGSARAQQRGTTGEGPV